MKTIKNKLFLATAILALASCADNTYIGDQDINTQKGNGGTISFDYNFQNATRSTSEEAGKLNNQFIVWGEKNETTGNLQTAAGANGRDGDLVFPNYIVNYIASSAQTTTSNTNGWEYVGFKFDDSQVNPSTANYSTYVTPNTKPQSGDAPAQTIKYWDNSATSYTFTAVSALPADISAGRVSIEKIKSGSSTVTSVYGKGYEITLAKDGSNNYPSLANLYFADRINIAQANYTHNPVQFNFRNTLSHVRVGIYETIPGYEISEIKFYKADGTTEYNNGANTPVSAFGAVCPNVSAANFVGTVNVTYYDDSNQTIENHPKVTVTPGTDVAKTDLVLGTNFSTLTTSGTPKYLGTVATAPTYDTDGGTFTSVLPQVNNTTPLKLKVNYKLYNTVTKEVIQITGKTAEIPAKYLQWKANYKYTYLFKITDDNLNPITFDAVTVEAENGQAEYITTVSEPSITTFGVTVNSNNEFLAYQKDKNEYQVPSGTDKLDIYATIMDNHVVQTPTFGTNVNVYVATTTDATNFPITEASIANAIANTTTTPISYTKITSNDYSTYFGAAPAQATEVPGEDGKCISTAVNTGTQPTDWPTNYFTDKECTTAASTFTANTTYYKKFTDALKLTGVKYPGDNKAYVIEYIYDNSTKKAYKVIKVAASN